MISINPSQKFGIEMPSVEKTVVEASKIVYRLTAAKTPAGIAITSEMKSASTFSRSVFGAAASRRSLTLPTPEGDGLAEVPVQMLLQPCEVLHMDRLIQPPEVTDRFALFGRRFRLANDQIHRITGCEMEDREDHQRHEPDDNIP